MPRPVIKEVEPLVESVCPPNRIGKGKIQFHETIKEIEQRLGDPAVRSQSFIVSNTPSHTMRMLWKMEKDEMLKRHILFQEEDKDSYVRSMLNSVVVQP
ncbi:hypothetical protein [Methylocystis sp.]|uniref:hypothetical protein n=1 Tax=Methylocystis sp. TaxID=1911079 RepID=UPI003DA535EA